MKESTGGEKMDADTVLEYFAPLQKWMTEQNEVSNADGARPPRRRNQALQKQPRRHRVRNPSIYGQSRVEAALPSPAREIADLSGARLFGEPCPSRPAESP